MSRFLFIAAICCLFVSPAFAACVGTRSYSSCSGAYGNNYNISRFGNTTTMTGSNFRTGSQWSANSTRMGNTTITNGLTNGRSWNMMQQNLGGGITTYSGTNSRGQSFGGTCVLGRC